jgi:hypothetical protein
MRQILYLFASESFKDYVFTHALPLRKIQHLEGETATTGKSEGTFLNPLSKCVFPCVYDLTQHNQQEKKSIGHAPFEAGQRG